MVVKGCPWDKHVAVGSLGVGTFSTLQDNYGIPPVAVYKVDPEVGPTRRPLPHADLNRSYH